MKPHGNLLAGRLPIGLNSAAGGLNASVSVTC